MSSVDSSFGKMVSINNIESWLIFFKKINLWVQNESLEGKITVDGTVEKYKARFWSSIETPMT